MESNGMIRLAVETAISLSKDLNCKWEEGVRHPHISRWEESIQFPYIRPEGKNNER